MKPKRLKIMQAVGGKFYFNSKLEIVCYWQELQFKIAWLNFGHCFTSSCLSCLIITNSFKNGSAKI